MKTDSNTMLLILATLVVGVGAYWYFFTGTGNEPPLTATPTGNVAQTQFQALVSELQISFNTKILLDPRFVGLVNLATPVTPESAGRMDPFAALGR